MAVLENVKILLNLQDDLQDNVLNVIIKNVESELLTYLPVGTTIPVELDYIVENVSVIRYNRIGAEGMSSESVEGRSATYNDDDFKRYLTVFERYKPTEVSEHKGSVTFC